MTGNFPAPAFGDVDVVPRYEFRTWGADLAEISEHIATIGGDPRIGETVEVYLPVKGALGINPKIRRSVLDVKVLIDTVDGFEQWVPRLKCVLPVTRSELVDDFFPLIGLDPLPLPEASYEADSLVADVADHHPGLGAVVVMKTRRLYRIDGCTAEVASVGVGTASHNTVAIESSHLDILGRVRSDLGLDHRKNQSYPRMIQQLQGWIGD